MEEFNRYQRVNLPEFVGERHYVLEKNNGRVVLIGEEVSFDNYLYMEGALDVPTTQKGYPSLTYFLVSEKGGRMKLETVKLKGLLIKL